MAVVVSIGDYRNKDTVAVLRELLVRATKGQVTGFAFNVEFADGRQKSGFTGKYRANAAEALRVANRMSLRLNEVADLQLAMSIVAEPDAGEITQRLPLPHCRE